MKRVRFGMAELARLLFVRVPYVLTGVLMLAAIAINFANVIARYVFSSAIFWTEEALVFLMLWSMFLAAVTIAFNGDHINMDLLFERFTPRWKIVVTTSASVAFIACTLFVAVQSWQVVSLHYTNGTRSVAAGVPMVVPHAALLVAFALMALAAGYRALARWLGQPDPAAADDVRAEPGQ